MKAKLKQKIAFHSAVVVACLTLAVAGQAAPLPLHAQGDCIVDSAGKTVTLRGVNLGGWLVEEPWMQPFVTKPPEGTAFAPVKDHVSLWGTLEKRLGTAGMRRVRTAFRNAWITEADFDRIQKLGCNCVRLPFLASLPEEPGGMAWLDKAVGWASARGMYVVLDMHGAPGSQSDQDHTGQADKNAFFKDPANVAQAVSLWTRLAWRYRNNPAVAGYDLINEPTGTPSSDTLYVVEDRLYHAVRVSDTKHIVFIEDGYTGIQWMPFPAPCGWQNVAYSTHYYNFKAKSASDQAKSSADYVASVETERARRHIPYYVGEFGLEPGGTPEVLSGLLASFVTENISYSSWTYKVMWTGGGHSLWAFYSNPEPVSALNPFEDSEAVLIRKCAQLRTEKLTGYPEMAAAFQNAARQARTASALSSTTPTP